MPDRQSDRTLDPAALTRRHWLAGAGAAALASVAPAWAQAPYPNRPIRLIVPYPAGGPLDIAARALAERVKESLGTVVVENRPGAGGNIGVDALARSAPDGYTLGIGAVATHAINPWLFAKMPYDALRDFTPVTLIAHVPNVLVMTPETAARLKIDSVRDLVEHARRNPGKLNYASGGNGSGGHMAGELLKSSAKVFIVHIPYAGAAPAQLSLLSGQTDFMFDNLASAATQIRTGKLRAFAVTTKARAAAMPEVPTLAEAGGKELEGFDVSTWFGVFAPANLPAPLLARLSDELRKALATPELRARLGGMAAEPAPMTPEAFAAFVRSEHAKYEKVVKFSGARVD